MNNIKTITFLLAMAIGLFTFTDTILAETVYFDGLIEPCKVIDIGTPTRGVIAVIRAEKSDEVKAGDILVELDSSVEKAAVSRAKAQAAITGEIKLQQEKLKFAQRAYDRINDLFANKAISTQKKDESETEVSIAKFRLQKAKENQILANLDLKRAKAMLNQRRILSPLSGVVMERFVSLGEFVDDKPLMRVACINPLKVEVVLPATMFGHIKTGMKASVKSELQQDEEYIATVAIVERVIDSASGTFRVRLMLPNPDYLIPSGLKCTVHFLPPAATEQVIPVDTEG